MAIKPKYEAKDGTMFNSRYEAERWDTDCFTDWLETGPQIDAQHFWQMMDERKDVWFDSSEKQIVKNLLRKYWDNYIP